MEPRPGGGGFLQARLDFEGLRVQPAAEVVSPWLPSQQASFYWTLTAQEAGSGYGTAWLFFLAPGEALNTEGAIAVSAQTLGVGAARFLGMGGASARATGAALLITAVGLGWPNIKNALLVPRPHSESRRD
jgi:hypothetical protein